MNGAWNGKAEGTNGTRWLALALVLAWMFGARECRGGGEGASFTLGTDSLGRGSARRNWIDLRVEVQTAFDPEVSLIDVEPRIGKIEVRLPLTSLWVGYELSAEEDEIPRATIALRRDF
jgi:hypothetical protein